MIAAKRLSCEPRNFIYPVAHFQLIAQFRHASDSLAGVNANLTGIKRRHFSAQRNLAVASLDINSAQGVKAPLQEVVDNAPF